MIGMLRVFATCCKVAITSKNGSIESKGGKNTAILPSLICRHKAVLIVLVERLLGGLDLRFMILSSKTLGSRSALSFSIGSGGSTISSNFSSAAVVGNLSKGRRYPTSEFPGIKYNFPLLNSHLQLCHLSFL